MQLPMFYRDIVALSRERHRDWYIDTDQGYAFAAKTNAVYIAAAEFAACAREYPIVFAKGPDGNELSPMVVLGLTENDNLMIGDDGAWKGGYVPAYIRRYPFIIASQTPESTTFTVCIDESYSGFNTANEGERLMNEDGEHGEQLSNTVNFLQQFHQQTLVTRELCKALQEADLVEPIQANIALKSGPNFSLSGLMSVRLERLRGLSGKKLKDLLDAGYLELAFLQMHSLANFDKLMQIADEAGAGTAEAAEQVKPAPAKKARAKKD